MRHQPSTSAVNASPSAQAAIQTRRLNSTDVHPATKPSNHGLRICESRELGQGVYDEVNGLFLYRGSVYASPGPNRTLPVAPSSSAATPHMRDGTQSTSSMSTSIGYPDDDTLCENGDRNTPISAEPRVCSASQSSHNPGSPEPVHQSVSMLNPIVRESQCTTMTSFFAQELEGDVFGAPERLVADPAKHKGLYIPEEKTPLLSSIPLDTKSTLPRVATAQTKQHGHAEQNINAEFLQHDPYECTSADNRTSHVTTATSLFGGNLLDDVFAAAPMGKVDVAKHREIYLPPIPETPEKATVARSKPNTPSSTGKCKPPIKPMQIQSQVYRNRGGNQPTSTAGPAPITKYDYLLVFPPEVDY